ncbi:MAG: FliM/FliN family flagellar motor switch protein [Puniceicoccales bacterium]|jgi:type III secretion system YscQ/HrcQ family protein|nr:FliM/FliN family flagellar motor switch protein [Puniceicoccales bacterium]
MDEDEVILVDLSGLVDPTEKSDGKENDNVATADATAEQQAVYGIADHGNSQEDMDTDNVAALSIPIAAAESNSTGPLPTPPKAGNSEKVDTSQLDAELAKMKATSSGSAKLPTPSMSQTQKNHSPAQPEQAVDSAMPKAQENLIPKQQNGGTLIMDDNEGEPMQSKEENAILPAMDNEKNDKGDSEEEASEGITEISEENDSDGNEEDPTEDEENVEADESEEGDDYDVSHANTQEDTSLQEDNTVQAGDAVTADEESSIDPQFVEKTIQDIHADTQAPQMDNFLAEQMHPLEAQQVNYEPPIVDELIKQSALAKNTNIYSSVPLEKMPIVLTFETGRQKITIGELEKVKEGYTFECGNSIEAPVTICANDTPIGTGELLDIDGRIGVRIIEFYNK